MKKIKLSFVDFSPEQSNEYLFLTKILSAKYTIINSVKPDFVIYGPWGGNYLNYDCVRIFYTSENLRPNFNVCDYALGFDWMSFEDRYYRLPYYRHQPTFNLLKSNKIIKAGMDEKKFCNFIYSNGSASKERGEFFTRLSRYKKVDSGGRFMNNLGFLVESKLEFMSNYKFSIAFENASSSGYTTEKIVDAKLAGTIPIYWGNKNICKDFNTKGFVNCHDYENFEQVIKQIEFLDRNNDAYLEMLNEPLLPKNEVPEYLEEEYILNFFVNIIEQGPKNARRRCGVPYESFIEKDLKAFSQIENNPLNYIRYLSSKATRKIKKIYLSLVTKSNAMLPRIIE